MKFKYFFDSSIGTPGEKQINEWLDKNKNIEIISVNISNNGCLAVFYKEVINDKFIILSKEELTCLDITSFFEYQNEFYIWQSEYFKLLNQTSENFYK